MKHTFLFIILCCISNMYLVGQVSDLDMEGCADNPMFSRLPNFYLYDCSDNFAELELHVSADSIQRHEGNRSYIEYRFIEGKNPSWLQVTRNYENVILKMGGKKIFSNNEFASYGLFKNGTEKYIQLQRILNDEYDVIHYSLIVFDKEPMRQDITANDMFITLCNMGAIALNILFDTGKSTIQAESIPIVDQVAQMMATNPTLNVSIEGHTDDVGDAASNKTLSLERAQAVSAAIVSRGVDKSRIVTAGWGEEKPCGDNATEEGRMRNRRVEIVKM